MLAVFRLRHAAVIAMLGSRSGPPSRVGLALARTAAWCAIGAVSAVLAIPVLALLDQF